MSDETTLLPCPFCGSEAEKMTSSDGFTSIGCLRCNPIFGVMIQRNTEAEAIAAWNTRATHGTLTADDVRDLIERHSDASGGNGRDFHNGAYKAIADELSAHAERTCEPNWVLQGETQTQEFWRCECGNCGECFGVEDRSSFPFKMTIDEVKIPNYCPNCGWKVGSE